MGNKSKVGKWLIQQNALKIAIECMESNTKLEILCSIITSASNVHNGKKKDIVKTVEEMGMLILNAILKNDLVIHLIFMCEI